LNFAYVPAGSVDVPTATPVAVKVVTDSVVGGCCVNRYDNKVYFVDSSGSFGYLYAIAQPATTATALPAAINTGSDLSYPRQMSIDSNGKVYMAWGIEKIKKEDRVCRPQIFDHFYLFII